MKELLPVASIKIKHMNITRVHMNKRAVVYYR